MSGLTSCLYDCEVVHVRLSPKRHRFSYRLFYFDLDLNEIPRISREIAWFGHNRFHLYTFRDQDHLDLGQLSLRDNLTEWLRRQGLILPEDARIRLITLPRFLGYVFNPVSFYFISNASGRPLHVVVEVCNTFLELKPWLIEAPERPDFFRIRVPKHFYVSPFSSLTAEFEFRIQVPGDGLRIHINDYDEGNCTLRSWIKGDRKELTNSRLLWYTLKFPLLTFQVILKIHWQAILLWLKGVPFHRKTDNAGLQRDLFRPHQSLHKSTPP
jgi:DUF1365 family protein